MVCKYKKKYYKDKYFNVQLSFRAAVLYPEYKKYCTYLIVHPAEMLLTKGVHHKHPS